MQPATPISFAAGHGGQRAREKGNAASDYGVEAEAEQVGEF